MGRRVAAFQGEPITREDVVWLAGVLDSLARIRVRETDASDLAEISISSPNLKLLDHVAQLTGVRVVRVRRHYSRLGCREHCSDPHHVVDSDTGRWQLTGARAVVVLRAVRPSLVVLAADVDNTLRQVGDAPTKNATLKRMRDLGWVVVD